MANIKSAEKRIRQSEKQRAMNIRVKSSIRTAMKKVNTLIDSNEKEPEKIKELYQNFTKIIDTATGKGTVRRRTAARKKSRLAKKVNAALK